MDERCSVCGRRASVVVDMHSMGLTKHVAYCDDCLRNVLKIPGKRNPHPQINEWVLFNSKPKLQMRTEFSEIDFFSLLSDNLKKTFGKELGDEERIRYKLTRLRREMERAIQSENYELAGILKREIDQLESNFKRTR